MKKILSHLILTYKTLFKKKENVDLIDIKKTILYILSFFKRCYYLLYISVLNFVNDILIY